jgi:methionyl-tRNA formyltransferase
MKIGYFADGPWSHKSLDKLVAAGHEIAFITPRFDRQDPFLKVFCEKNDIFWLVENNVNSDKYIDRVSKFNCDAFVSMSFNQIIKKKLISMPPKGFINCHAGALPFYRGRNPINWALINGDSRIGVTAHYIDEGIDTGDILLQDFISVDDDDNYATLLAKGFEQCAETLTAAVMLLQKDERVGRKQSEVHPVGFYCSRRIDGDEYIDWSKSSNDIFNLVRAITRPGPGAIALSRTHHLRIYGCKKITNAPNYIGTPGEIVGLSDGAWVVKTGDSTLLLTDIEDISNRNSNINFPAFKLRIGDRLGLTYGDLVKGYLDGRIGRT